MQTLARRISTYAVLAAACLSLVGCDTLSDHVKPAAYSATASAMPKPRTQSGDKIKLVIYGEDKMSGDYEIDANGMIQVPLIGAVRVAGMTKKEIESSIAHRLRSTQILLNPVVTVDVVSSRPVYVMGEVEKPGEYTYRNGLNVLSAVAVAGGFTYRASKSKILVKRAGEKGLTEFSLSPDIPVYPGDLISVPERYF
ncbi:MAG: polysaccharide export protein [Rhodoblastus sp.]|nr:polysaccharide export protein [Rhodoblastus sp.]